MRYAVMSDVHANPKALAKAFVDAEYKDSLVDANADVQIWLEDITSR